MPADIGGSGWLALTYETAVGAYLPPTTLGTFWIPILSESLHYVEDAYYSPQIRQKTSVGSRNQGYYHVEGDIVIEGDSNVIAPLMYCTRHNITKNPVGTISTTGNTHSNTTIDNIPSTAGLLVGSGVSGTGIPGGTTLTAVSANSVTLSAPATQTGTGVSLSFTQVLPNEYVFSPAIVGSSETNPSGATRRTCSFTVRRAGVMFGYTGCIINTMQLEIDASGVERWTLGILGLGEQIGTNTTAVWADPVHFPPQNHTFTWASIGGAAPTYDLPENGLSNFTWNANFNGSPQNRIVSARQAQYIAYGESEINFSGMIDFLDRTQYDDFKNNAMRGMQLRSWVDGTSYATSSNAFTLSMPFAAIDTYEMGIGAIGDLITADLAVRALSPNGGNAYAMRFKTGIDIP